MEILKKSVDVYCQKINDDDIISEELNQGELVLYDCGNDEYQLEFIYVDSVSRLKHQAVESLPAAGNLVVGGEQRKVRLLPQYLP